MKLHLLLAILGLLVVGVGCVAVGTSLGNRKIEATSEPQVDTSNVVVVLHRMGCYGSCPIYSITIYDDGTVLYEGKEFVKVRGKHSAHITTDAVAALVAEFEQLDFFSLQNKYTNPPVSDHESVNLSFTQAGVTHVVEHYHGDPNAPNELTSLEDRVDDVANSARWTGPRGE